MDFDSKKT